MQRVLLFVLTALAAVAAQAQGWPNKPVTMVNPFAPGGGVDAFGRPLSIYLSKTLGTQFLVVIGGAFRQGQHQRDGMVSDLARAVIGGVADGNAFRVFCEIIFECHAPTCRGVASARRSVFRVPVRGANRGNMHCV